jgi:hypothetical protein
MTDANEATAMDEPFAAGCDGPGASPGYPESVPCISCVPSIP